MCIRRNALLLPPQNDHTCQNLGNFADLVWRSWGSRQSQGRVEATVLINGDFIASFRTASGWNIEEKVFSRLCPDAMAMFELG